MYYAYILISQKNGRHYYGSTQDIESRLQKHNSGKVKSTKGYRPWSMLYYETFKTRSEAFQRGIIKGQKWLESIGII